MSRKLQRGKFYRIEDPSGQAHVGMIFKLNKRKNTANVVKFSHSSKKAKPLEENIDPDSKEPSYVRKQPEHVGQKYIKKHYPTYRVVNKKDKVRVEWVKRNPIKDRTKKKK